MSVTRIRAHHEVLGQISQSFRQQAEAVKQSLHDLQEKQNVLQNGDWRGESATQFYAEMDERVLPAVQRLAAALDGSASLTQQAGRIMKQAEEESARLFKAGAMGGPLVAGGSAGVGPGMAALADKDGGGGAGSSAGGGSGSGSSTSGGSGAGVGPTVGSPKPGSVPFKAELFDKLNPGVQKVAGQSPTLMKELNDLKRDKWDVSAKPHPANDPDTPSETFVLDKKLNIYLDPNQTAENGTMRIAHEAGIAKLNPPLVRVNKAGLTENQFIKTNLPLIKQAEGEGLFNEVLVRNEILKSSANNTDIGLSDNDKATWPQYQKLLEAEQNKTISHTEAVNKMLGIYETAVKKDNNGDDLNALYTKALQQDWAEFKKTGKAPPM